LVLKTPDGHGQAATDNAPATRQTAARGSETTTCDGQPGPQATLASSAPTRHGHGQRHSAAAHSAQPMHEPPIRVSVHTRRVWTGREAATADRERWEPVGPDELIEAIAADPQPFGNLLMVRSRSRPSSPAGPPSGMGRDGISDDERGQVGLLDEEFFGDTLRNELLGADQPPHGMRPDAEPCGHLPSGEVQPVSLGLHGVCSPPFYCSGSRSGLMRTCPRLSATCPSDSSNPGDAREQWIPRSDRERAGADPDS